MRGLGSVFRKGLYRSRSGLIMGVCRGIAEYFDFSVFWTRVITFMIFLFSGLWPVVVLYFVAALVMRPEPVIPIQDEEHQEFYDSYVHSRRSAADRIKRRYKNLERRIQRMEDLVTTREFDWDSRFNS